MPSTNPVDFKQSGNGYSTYTDTASIVWTGTTAPSGTLVAQYRWQQVGRTVSLIIGLNYSIAGSALTAMTMNLPADCPTPVNIAGLGGSANHIMYVGAAAGPASDTGSASNNTKLGLYKNTANTGFILSFNQASANTKDVLINIDYTAA